MTDDQRTEPTAEPQSDDWSPFSGDVPEPVEWMLGLGWWVIEEWVDTKAPKHEGYKLARRPDEELRRAARLGATNTSFGFLCGTKASDHFVLDFDERPARDGKPAVRGLATMRALGLAPTWTTPGGGAQVLVHAPGEVIAGRTFNADPTGRFPGMDVKGENDKTTFWGRRNGRRYTWPTWPPAAIRLDTLPIRLRAWLRAGPPTVPQHRPTGAPLADAASAGVGLGAVAVVARMAALGGVVSADWRERLLAGKNVSVRCPLPDHGDRRASAQIGAGVKRPVLFRCHGGCSQRAFVEWATQHGLIDAVMGARDGLGQVASYDPFGTEAQVGR